MESGWRERNHWSVARHLLASAALIIALCLPGFVQLARAGCHGNSCNVHAHGTVGGNSGGNGGGGNGGGRVVTYTPPPVEPLCSDQGGNPRPQFHGIVSASGQQFYYESIDCSSTGAGSRYASQHLGLLQPVTYSP